MNNITVTVELCAEDRARLDRIAGLLADMQPKVYRPEPAPAEPAQETPTAPAEEKPTENPPEAETPATPDPVPAEEPEKVPTADELRAIVQTLIAAGHRDDVKAIVQTYAVKVSDVPADKRAECIEKLQALKEGKA